MSFQDWFSFAGTSQSGSAYLPDIFPMPIKESEFVTTDVVNIFTKILTDVVERTQGVKDELQPLLWDNCLQSEAGDGLISLLAKAMEGKQKLFLVYKKETGVIRKATEGERLQIEIDYKKSGKSSTGVFISFENFKIADMIKLYSALEYCAISALNKSMNVSKALQYKVNDLRASVGLNDQAKAKAQASDIADALSNGHDVFMDAKDSLETAIPNLEATKEAIAFMHSKRCFYLGLPMSYITGELPKGLGDTGEGDSKAVERGLKNYFFSIIKPVLESIFEIKASFKSQDFRQISSALEALKMFELVSEEYISKDNKLLIVNKLLDVDSKLGVEPEPEPVQVPGAPDPNGKAPPPFQKPGAQPNK